MTITCDRVTCLGGQIQTRDLLCLLSFSSQQSTSALYINMPPRRTSRAVAPPSYLSDSDSSISSTPSSPPAQKAAKRTRKAANSRKSDTVPPSKPQINLDHIERGGKAATELWNTLEVRDKILNFIPRGTLPALLRLEKAVTASVSAVLYRSIHVSLMSRMSRASVSPTDFCGAFSIPKYEPPVCGHAAVKTALPSSRLPANISA